MYLFFHRCTWGSLIIATCTCSSAIEDLERFSNHCLTNPTQNSFGVYATTPRISLTSWLFCFDDCRHSISLNHSFDLSNVPTLLLMLYSTIDWSLKEYIWPSEIPSLSIERRSLASRYRWESSVRYSQKQMLYFARVQQADERINFVDGGAVPQQYCRILSSEPLSTLDDDVEAQRW